MHGNGYDTMWFFWGQDHLSFMRYITLLSAKQVHDDVRLIIRGGEPVRDEVTWTEDQDFRHEADGKNWLQGACEIVGENSIYPLDYIAPEIAKLRAPDIHTSDLLSWYLLAKRGGTVADMDIVFIKPIPKVEHDVQVIRQKWPRETIIPVGFMQGRPCETWDQIYQLALKRYDPNDYQSCGTNCAQPSIGGQISPFVAYPWSGQRMCDIFNWMFGSDTWPELPEECCAIHWYAGGNQHWNQKIKSIDDCPPGAIRWAINLILERQKESEKLCESQ